MHVISDILDCCFERKKEACMIPLQTVQAHFSSLLSNHVKASYAQHGYQYSLDFFASRLVQYSSHSEIFWETQYGLILCVQDRSEPVPKIRPIAVIGFEKKSNHLFVPQVQGVKGAREYLRPIRWAHLLYCALIVFGRELKIEEIRVCPGDSTEYNPFRNSSVSRDCTLKECEVWAARLRLIYDKASQQCGFKWVERTRTYTYSLSQ